MTSEFLRLLVLKYPNSYELGEVIRKFYFFFKEHKSSMSLIDIENEFSKKYVNTEFHFQKL